jgi:hypothetical protein
MGEGRGNRESGKLHVGAALMAALDWPDRLSLKRTDSGWRLIPASRFGLKVTGGGTSRRLAIGADAAEGLQLPDIETVYDATVSDDSVVF